MTIKGSLQISIPIVKASLTRNFLFRRKLAKNLRFGVNGVVIKILLPGPRKGTSLCETTLFEVLIMKIEGVGVPDVITRANLGDNRFKGFGGSRGRISHFSIDLRCHP